jgi:hypothetical protein
MPDSGEFGLNLACRNPASRPNVVGFWQRLPNSIFRRWRILRASQMPKNIFEKIIFSEK